MTQRLKYAHLSPGAVEKLTELEVLLGKSSIEHSLIDLVKIRASQLNGCAFCIDMHVKQATLRGEHALRLHHLACFEESPLFTEREKSALRWAEVVTRVADSRVPDVAFEAARRQFDERELSDLTFVIGAINFWNRLSVAFRAEPGSLDAFYGLNKSGLS